MAEQNEAIFKLIEFFEGLIIDGCPPSGDCKKYKIGDTKTVDCELCAISETAKILDELGYHKIDPSKLTLIGDEEIEKLAFDTAYLTVGRATKKIAEAQLAHTKKELGEENIKEGEGNEQKK